MTFLNSVRVAPGVPSAVAVAVCVCVLGIGEVAQAAEADSALEPVVVTATRVPTTLSEVLADVTVISRQEIERQGAGDLATLLSRQAGFEFDRNGGPGSSTGMFLRGANSRFTAVLIDGVRVDSQNLQGGASWNALPLSTVDRIEIVRGAASTVYGSDAVAGVVQIFTKQGRDKPVAVDLGMAVGSPNTTKWDANLSGAGNGLDYAASVTQERSTGSSAVTNPASSHYNADKDGYRLSQWAARLGWQVVDGHRVEVSSTQNRTRVQFDDGVALDPRSYSTVATQQASWRALWTPALRGTYVLAESTDKVSIDHPDYAFDVSTRVRTVSAQHDLQLGEHGFHALFERRQDQLTEDYLTEPSVRRSQNGVGLGYDWKRGGHALQVKWRQEADSEFGCHDTGSVAAGWALSSQWHLRGSLASAFRAPSSFERFASAEGNAALKPESSRHAEVSLAWKQGVTQASATVYRNRINNLIDYDFVSGTYLNVGEADLQGLELAAQTHWEGWRLNGSVDVQDPRNAVLDKQLVRRAREHAFLQVERDVAGWTVGSQWKLSGHRYDDPDNTKRLGGYGVLNFFAQHQIDKQWNVLLKVDNVFDKAYETALNYRMTGVSGLIAVRYTPAF
jgi:vitamin B12 transporter